LSVAGTVEEQERFSKRLVRADKSHSEDCRTLLKLMGVPIVDVSITLHYILLATSSIDGDGYVLCVFLKFDRHLVRLRPNVQLWLKLAW